MQIKQLYRDAFIEKINRSMHHVVLNPNQDVGISIPIEDILIDLGYQIKTSNRIHTEIEVKNQNIYVRNSIGHTRKRWLLARFLGQLIYQSQQN